MSNGELVGKAPQPGSTEFIIAGDSHIFAMGAAQGYSGPCSLKSIEGVEGRGYFLMEPWAGDRGQSYWEALAFHSKDRIAVLVVMGNTHFGNFLIAQPPLFDFIDPSDPQHSIYPNARLVPRRLVKALPLFQPTRLREIIEKLKRGGCGGIVICGTPPVRPDYDDVRDLRTSEFFRKVAARMGTDIETCAFTPAPIMKRLWGVLQEILEDTAKETGAKFLSSPKGASDKDGYLLSDYRRPASFTHANDSYGRLMLKNISDAVRGYS